MENSPTTDGFSDLQQIYKDRLLVEDGKSKGEIPDFMAWAGISADESIAGDGGSKYKEYLATIISPYINKHRKYGC
jgi:hypothetical protein